jgi:hypothetical protein
MLPLAAQILRSVDLPRVNEKTLEFVLTDPNDGSLLFNQFEKFVGDNEFWEMPDFHQQLDAFAGVIAMREIWTALETLGAKIPVQKDQVRIYRSLIVEPGWMGKEMFDRPLGIFWSYDRAGVGAYDGSPKKLENPLEILLTADVALSDIDWTETLALKAGSRYAHGEEFEIRLLTTASVTLQNIEWRKNDFANWCPKQLPSEHLWVPANFAHKGIVLSAGVEAAPSFVKPI